MLCGSRERDTTGCYVDVFELIRYRGINKQNVNVYENNSKGEDG